MDEDQPLIVSSGSQGSEELAVNVYTWRQFVMDVAGRDDTEWHASVRLDSSLYERLCLIDCQASKPKLRIAELRDSSTLQTVCLHAY